MPQKIVTNLWFDTEAQDAAEFYCSIFENSRIVNVSHYNDAVPDKAGSVLTVDFELDGQRFTGINGGPQFTFTEATSLLINCKDQEEIDYFWDKLTEGGEERPCGWCKDRYGFSWQVVPVGMDELFARADQEPARRAMEAMFGMKKIDVAALKAAADGVPAA
jgi:predicted 3-demethylubiquinone-9 3-methyltransferase (glyoxalase superfamily)